MKARSSQAATDGSIMKASRQPSTKLRAGPIPLAFLEAASPKAKEPCAISCLFISIINVTPLYFLIRLVLFLAGLTFLAPFSSAQSDSAAYTFSTFAGYAGNGSADGLGSVAQFFQPDGVVADGAGNIYVADTFNHTIRKVTRATLVSTIAGFAKSPGGVD